MSKLEISVSLVLLLMVFLFLDPFMIWMPSELVYMALGGLIIAFVIVAGFVWKERARDEREYLHTMIAGIVAYLTGAGLLVIAITVQTVLTHPDPWLVITLAGMVIARILGFIYAKKTK